MNGTRARPAYSRSRSEAPAAGAAVNRAGVGRTGPVRIPWVAARRWLFFSLVSATTALGTVLMSRIVRAGGVHWLEILILLLFASTFAWISLAFWTGLTGFALRLLRRDPLTLEPLPTTRPTSPAPRSRTALVMPVFNEDPERVLRGLEAVVRSVAGTGHGLHFDAFLLSDTTDPEIAREEEAGWEALRRAPVPGFGRLFYRRRPDNEDRKAGNIADFCRRWGDDYEFMVVLDADSVMTGATLTTLVRRMEEDPALGLVQTVPVPGFQDTLFGRMLQLGAAVQAPVFAAGQSFWQADSANYWGHNAIVRVSAFREHCRLPVLPGNPPLGGAILSHDFVEAALLRRGGWRVQLHAGLEGSFEGLPGNIPDYAARDRRWSQGSLQHLRLLATGGMHPVSRLHFLFGAMGYVSSLLWLLLLLAGTAYVLVPGTGSGTLWSRSIPGDGAPLGVQTTVPGSPEVLAPLVSLLAATALLLLLPKLLAFVLALVRKPGSFGGARRLGLGFLVETCFSVAVAPLMMMYHSRFVVSILTGHDVSWNAQDRDGKAVPWRTAWRHAGWVTLAGAAWAGLTLYHSAAFFLWLTPIFLGLIGSVPLIRFTSHPAPARWARKLGLFLVPAETDPHNVLEEGTGAVPEACGATAGDEEALRPGSDTDGTGSGRRAVRPTPMKRDGRMERAERALFELQRGRPLLLDSRGEGEGSVPEDGVWLIAAVEGLRSEALSWLRDHGAASLRLVLTDQRARTVGLIPPAGTDPLSSNGKGSESGNGSERGYGSETGSGPEIGSGSESGNGSERVNGSSGERGTPGRSDNGDSGSGWSVALGTNGASPSPERILHLSSSAAPGFRALHDPGDVRPASGAESSGLDLVRLGRMLPALVSVPVARRSPALERAVERGTLLRVSRDEIRALTGPSRLEVLPVSDAQVPLEDAEEARFILFQERPGLQEHLAVVIGARERWPDPVPVRVHSACLTGDLFGSLRCDCGEQLRGSLRIFSGEGGGVLLYMAQEGRSIGLGNKLRAYALQQEGLDTVDANQALGFGADDRRYEAAVAMLRHLGIERIQLLTNNPEKVRAMETGGIRVLDRVPLHGTLNRHNLPYVRAKVRRSGHWLEEMLGTDPPIDLPST